MKGVQQCQGHEEAWWKEAGENSVAEGSSQQVALLCSAITSTSPCHANALLLGRLASQWCVRGGLRCLQHVVWSGPIGQAPVVLQTSCLYSGTSLYRTPLRPSWLSCIQCNLSIVDTIGTQLAVQYTVEPLYRGHLWDPAGCPVYSVTSLEDTFGTQLASQPPVCTGMQMEA